MTYIESFLKRKILRLPVQKDSRFQGQIETKPVLGFNCLRGQVDPTAAHASLSVPHPQGRGGKGSIYVWASGDGGSYNDCNCDGYASSMWTISINSAINDGRTALYDESCSSTLPSTFSNGQKGNPEAGVVSEGQGCARALVTSYAFTVTSYAFTVTSWKEGPPSKSQPLFRGEMHPSSRLVMFCYQGRGLTKNKSTMTSFPLMVHRFSCSLFRLTNNDEL